MSSRRHPLLYLMLALMVGLWSANFIVAKIALREFPAVLLAGLRVGLAGLMILPVYRWQTRASGETWTREEAPLLVALGLCGAALNQLCFVLGLSRTSVAHASIIMGLTPIVVLGLAVAMKLERLTGRKLTGMLAALGGIAILKAFETAGSGPTWLGDLLVFLAALTFSVFAAFGKKLVARHSSITVNTFGYVGGGVFMAPLVVWHGWDFAFGQVSAGGWLSLIYMALFPSLVCYLIFYYALTHIPASRVSALSYFQPLLATLMAVSLLGERLTGSVVAGGAVILAGVWLAERG